MSAAAVDRRYTLAVAALILVSAAALTFTARLQFDWFDMSGFLDAGWRVAGGQEPFVDFFYIAQPIHLWMHAAFFRLLGFNQSAVLAHLLTLHVVFAALLACFARRRLDAVPAFLVTAAGIIAFSGPVAHPWYDLTATIWLLAGMVSLDTESADSPSSHGIRPPSSAPRLLAAGLLASFAFLTKANIGLGAFLVLGGQALMTPRPLRAFGWFVLGAAAGAAVVLLFLAEPMEFFRQAFFAYPSRGRLGNLVLLYDVMTRLPFTWCVLLAIGACVVGGRKWSRVNRGPLAEVVIVAAAGIFGAFTGSLGIESKSAFAGPMLVGAWSYLRALPDGRRRALGVLAAGVTTAVLVQSLLASWPPRAWLWRPTNEKSTYAMRHESFRGWKTAAAIGPGIDRAALFLEENVPRDSTLLILPDATALYGMTGRQGYRGAPFMFHVGQLPPPGRDMDAFRARVAATPPDWILIHRQEEIPWCRTDATIRWLGMEPLLATYSVVHRDADFTVLRNPGRS